MSESKLVVELSGLARENFDKIHMCLENDVLTITSRSTQMPFGCKLAPNMHLAITRVEIVGSHDINLKEVVAKGVAKINEIYPNSAKIVETKTV